MHVTEAITSCSGPSALKLQHLHVVSKQDALSLLHPFSQYLSTCQCKLCHPLPAIFLSWLPVGDIAGCLSLHRAGTGHYRCCHEMPLPHRPPPWNRERAVGDSVKDSKAEQAFHLHAPKRLSWKEKGCLTLTVQEVMPGEEGFPNMGRGNIAA